MRISSIGHQLIERLADAPGVRHLRMARYERIFRNNVHANLFRGVYATFEEAERNAPGVKPVGYDNADSARLYDHLTRQIASYDYPVLHWLGRLFAGGATRVFDLGGHVGVAYYSYRKYLDYPANLEWTVFDLPAVLREGRARAAAQDHQRQLHFTDRLEDASGADVLFTSGALQYVPTRLGEILARLPARPRHLIVNQLPVHPQKQFFTLNSIGTAFCPYQVFSDGGFLEEIRRTGYELVDRWDNPGKRCVVPFPRGYSVEGYAGFYFRHVGT